jgi:hypothetical protein
MHTHTHENELPVLVPLKRAAKRIGLAPRTIEHHSADFFPVFKLGKHRYVLSADVAWWIFERHAQGLLRDGRVSRA